MDCPKCGLINPETAQRCDCGYIFPAKGVNEVETYKGNKEREALLEPENRKLYKVLARCHSQNVTEREALLEPEKHIEGELRRLRGVGGWLLFFCIMTTIIAPLVCMAEAANSNDAVLIVPDVALTILAFSTGLSLWRARPHALTWVRVYLIVGPCLAMIAGLQRQANYITYDPASSIYTNPVAGAIGYAVIWWVYFRKSKRVKATFGRNL